MTAFPTSNTRRIFEIMAVVFTAIGKFVFMDYLNWRFAYVAVVIISWSIYIFLRNKTNSEIVKSWGFRNDNILAVSKRVLPFAIVAIAISFFFGFYQNTINITWHIIPILILYPIWGIIQQFLLIGLTAGNLQDLKGPGLNRRIIILFSSLLFSSVHYPFIWLIIGTFILALFYGYIYLTERNIYVLGVFHGWLAAVFYYTVLDRDPFSEVFTNIFHLST